MDQAEASGKTVEDALNRALQELGASRDEVEFVVLDEGRKGGLFGRGGREAVVRVERVAMSEASPMQQPQPADTRIPRGNGRPQGQERPPMRQGGGDRGRPPRGGGGGGGGPRNRSDRPQSRTGFDAAVPKLTDSDFTRPASYDSEVEEAAGQAPDGGRRNRGPRPGGDSPRGESPRPERRPERRREEEPEVEPDINAEEVELAAQIVDDLLRLLDIDAELTIREPLTHGDGRGVVRAVIDISGEDLGLLIGRRGDTLLSLQYLVNLIVTRRFPGKGGVSIDVEHYRHRREEQVISLAQRMADRVRSTGTPITLEPMPPAERRLIHLAFADDPQLETNSVGDGDNRKVVISARR